jgi:nicotinamide mononucleotide (NMN) deamidase PncC
MGFSKKLADLAERALATAKAKGWSLITVESCTAGKLAALLSEAPGAGAPVSFQTKNQSQFLDNRLSK